MAEDFNYFKRNVSIVQIAEHLGYRFNPKAGRNKRVEYAHKDLPNIIITNPTDPATQLYFTRDDDTNKGSVIDFVKHRLSMFNVSYEKEFDGVNKVLHSFAQVPYDLPARLKSENVYEKTNAQIFDKEDYDISAPTQKDLSYLSLGRVLSDATIKRFMPFIDTVQTKHKDRFNFKNIGFPYRVPSNNDIVGYELVNYNFKHHASGSDKTNAVWTAELFEKGIRPTHIFFAESAIDAMSFFQLKRHKYSFDQSVFISVGGSLSKNQVTNVLAHYPHAMINTIFDNDISGKIFDIRVAAIKMNLDLSISKKPDQVTFTLKGKEPFSIGCTNLSLRAFCDASGVRPEVRAHKPEGKDFNFDLQNLVKATSMGQYHALKR